MTQWVPLYESDRAVVQSELATFFSVFPHGTIWANDDDGYGYDTVLLGQAEPLRLDLNRLEERLERRDHAPARAALAELGLGSVVDLLSTYTGRGSELRPWLARAAINHDRTLRLQYLAGLQLNSASGTATYEEMLSYRTFPDDLITASPARRAQLHRALGFPPSP
jgi:spermidine synthase